MFSEKQIKRTTEYNFEVEQKFGEWKSILDFKIVTEYDQNGDVIKIFSYFQDGVNDEFRFTPRDFDNEFKVWERNKNGKVIKHSIGRHGLGDPDRECNFKYDITENYLIESVCKEVYSTRFEELDYKSVYEYDKDWNKTKYTKYYGNGNIKRE